MKRLIGMLALVLPALLPAGCRTRAPAETPWQTEDFQTEIHPLSGSTKATATTRDGLLHVVDTGTQPGDLIVLERHWNALPATGAAVEARVRVVSCEGMAGVMLGFSDGVHEDLLTLYTDRIELHHAGLSHPMDTTGGFLVYRVDIQDNDVSVAVNGETVIDGAGRFTHPAHQGRNRVSFGAGSSAATGEAYWDWVRWRAAPIPRRPEERDLPGAVHHVAYKQPGRYACFPSLALDPATGRLYTHFAAKEAATHYEGGGGGEITMASADGGATWDVVDAIPPEARPDMPDGTFTAPDGALIRIGQNWRRWFPMERLDEFKDRYAITYGGPTRGGQSDIFAVNSGGYLQRSEDGGRTWARTEIPELDTYVSCSSPWSMTQLPDGTVLRAFMVRHDDSCSGKAYVALTRDGRSAEVIEVMGDPDNRLFFTEETLLHATSGGAVWLLTRVHGDGDYLWQAVSEDGGRTWTARQTGIDAGQSPPSGLVELDDGRLVLVYGYRRAPFGIRALISEDEGLTWRLDHVLVLRDDGDGFDLGYPRAVKLPGGDVLAIYYYATDDQVRHIACTRFTAPRLEP